VSLGLNLKYQCLFQAKILSSCGSFVDPSTLAQAIPFCPADLGTTASTAGVQTNKNRKWKKVKAEKLNDKS